MIYKKAQIHITPIEIIAGILLIIGGFAVMFGKINLGSFLASLGLLVELIKEISYRGL